jgi:hypothetical protein
MTTTRTPIGRPPRSRITPRSVEIFKEMQAGCSRVRWAELQGELADELRLAPHQWPPIIDPDAQESVYPAHTGGAEWHPQGKALWRELERAAAAGLSGVPCAK